MAIKVVPPKILSLRDQLKGAVGDFLDQEAMACPRTQEALVALIGALANYTEEGRALFPRIFIFDSLDLILEMMPGSQHHRIGTGAKRSSTVALALKKCAPLARSNWLIYIERRPVGLSYGLLRSGATAISLGPAEMLVDNGDSSVPVLMLQQVGANVIELKGVSKASLLVHFGSTQGVNLSPIRPIHQLVDCLTTSVPSDVHEQAGTFFRAVMTNVFRSGHGTLAAVIPSRRRTLPTQFSDSIPLAPPISVCDKLRALVDSRDSQTNMEVQAFGSLLSGMLQSDGITVFGSDGSVRAYNAFVRHPRDKSGSVTTGGARHRTFQVLSDMVGKGLSGAFMQSQDGRADFSGGAQ